MVRLTVRNRRDGGTVDEWICDANFRASDAELASALDSLDDLVITGYSREPFLLQGKEDPLHPELCEVLSGVELQPTNREEKLKGLASYLAGRKKAALVTPSDDLRLVLLPPEVPNAATINVVLYRRPRKFTVATRERPWEATAPVKKKPKREAPPDPRQQKRAAPPVQRPRGVTQEYESVDAEGYVWKLREDAKDGKKPAGIYFQDHRRRYLFDCGEDGLRLLEALVEANKPLLERNERVLRDTGAYERVAEDGKRIYADKNSLSSKGVTWTHEEYGHAGMQRVYLGTKCWQRFTETYNLLDRALPELTHVIKGLQASGQHTIRAASLGGGPGFELLALKKWLDRNFAELDSDLHSLDLQAEWEPYAKGLGLGFVGPWDITQGNVLQDLNIREGDLHLLIISYVLIYCCTPETAEMLAQLLSPPEEGGAGVKALIVSERSHEQPMIAMLRERGISCIRLMRQDNPREGTDERQLLFLAKDFDRTVLARVEHREDFTTFHNVPFMKGT